MTVMMSMVALGGIAAYIAGVVGNSEKILRKNGRSEAYREIISMVRSNLYAGNNCTVALGRQGTVKGAKLSEAFSASSEGDDVEIPMTIGQADLIMRPGWKSRHGIEIDSIKLKIDGPARSAPVRIHGDPTPKSAAYATLYISPKNNVVNLKKQERDGTLLNTNLFIKLFVYYEEIDGERTVFSCADPTGEAAFCTTALLGAYNPDPAVDSALRCQPDVNCFNYKSGIVPSSSSCPAPYSKRSVGMGYASCTWCNPNPNPAGAVPTVGFVPPDEIDYDIQDESDREISCTSSGYGLPPADEREARDMYIGNLSYLSQDQRNSHAGCLNYQPPTGGSTTPPVRDEPDDNCGRNGTIRCFVSGTQIRMPDDSTKNIEDIAVGENVVTYDEKTGEKIVSPVVSTQHHEAKPSTLFTFKLSNGKTLTSNDAHPIFISEFKRYFLAQEIYEMWFFGKDLHLLGENGSDVKIENIEREQKNVALYNFHVRGRYDTQDSEVDVNHNYFANGVLVHNKQLYGNVHCQ